MSLSRYIDPASLTAALAAGAYGYSTAEDEASPFLRGLMFGTGGAVLGKITPGYREAFDEFVREGAKEFERTSMRANARVDLL